MPSDQSASKASTTQPLSNGTLEIFASRSPPVPSPVFETYWYVAAERQRIFFNKIRDSHDLPYTEDPIFQKYKFTNAYRASDRVSQYLIQEVIYDGNEKNRSIDEKFFRVILFKTFNRISTWEILKRKVGKIRYENFDIERYGNILESAMQKGQSIYSGAYLMASGKHAFGHSRKHRNHLCLLETMMEENVPARVASSDSMEEVFHLLRSYPTIGDFLAYQYATDLNYSTLTNFSEMEFVVPGPGAESGIRKCFTDLGDYSESDIIRWMADHQEEAFERLNIEFNTLWGRPLQLIDCQNLFCEVDKYARRKHPDVKGTKGRTQIKQTYQPSLDPIPYWYPPKWGINDLIKLEEV